MAMSRTEERDMRGRRRFRRWVAGLAKKKKKKYSIIARERVESGGWLKVWKGVVAH